MVIFNNNQITIRTIDVGVLVPTAANDARDARIDIILHIARARVINGPKQRAYCLSDNHRTFRRYERATRERLRFFP